MSDTPNPATMPPEELIDQLCDDFERGWLERTPVPLERLVLVAPEAVRAELFRELLAVERDYRAREGRPVTPAEARERFAGLGEWASAAVQELQTPTASWPGVPAPEFLPQPDASSPTVGKTPERLPATVGGFRVVRVLGRGGMGAVYLADDPLGRRQVAVKVMRPDLAARPDARERFLREARSAMAVEHDNVVPVYQVGLDGAAPFLVMPVLKGESLDERLVREPLVPMPLVLKIGREIAQGLAAAHEKGLVHRDAKPANTWLEGDPAAPSPDAQVRRVRVLDFGLARAADRADSLTATGGVVGTPAYMAPEQAAGLAVGARADLFSLGAILYRMAAGRPAFPGKSLSAVLTAVATHTPPPAAQVNSAVPAALSALIERMLEKDPAKRPASAREVIAEIEAVERGHPSRGEKSRRFPVAVVLALVALVVAVGGWLLTRPATPRVDEAKATPTPVTPPTPSGPAAFKGSIDLLVLRKDLDGSDIAVPLGDVRAWPIKPGDNVKVVAEVDPPAFVYLFWIDETGGTFPIYPWVQLKWGTRPASESKVSRLEIKDPNNNWFQISGTIAGMETLLLVARPEPLAATEADVRGWFQGVRPLAFAGEKARAWFEGFDLVRHDLQRAPAFGGDTTQADGPLALQALLGRRIGTQAAFSRAVSFSRLGKQEGK